MKKVGIFLLLVSLPISVFSELTVWNEVISMIFSLPKLNFWQMLMFNLFWLSFKPTSKSKPETDEDFLYSCFWIFTKSAIIFLIIHICYLMQ